MTRSGRKMVWKHSQHYLENKNQDNSHTNSACISTNVCDLLSESAPDQERSIAFQQKITSGCSVYKTWLDIEKSK